MAKYKYPFWDWCYMAAKVSAFDKWALSVSSIIPIKIKIESPWNLDGNVCDKIPTGTAITSWLKQPQLGGNHDI
jgi:hypothetical protein